MNSGVVSTGNRSQIAIATGFLGAFIVGSLAVQMVRSQGGVAIDGTRPSAQVEPVIASPATLWADMGSRSELVGATFVITSHQRIAKSRCGSSCGI